MIIGHLLDMFITSKKVIYEKSHYFSSINWNFFIEWL
jgi:hypothetical protein